MSEAQKKTGLAKAAPFLAAIFAVAGGVACYEGYQNTKAEIEAGNAKSDAAHDAFMADFYSDSVQDDPSGRRFIEVMQSAYRSDSELFSDITLHHAGRQLDEGRPASPDTAAVLCLMGLSGTGGSAKAAFEKLGQFGVQGHPVNCKAVLDGRYNYKMSSVVVNGVRAK